MTKPRIHLLHQAIAPRPNRRPHFGTFALVALALFATQASAAESRSRPNIVLILADDIGYGDLGCYGATKVRTPNLDRLAREGSRFTDAHATASVCTPTRFALLTGRYAWRQPGTGIAPGDATLLIKPGTVTLASSLKSAGYSTGPVGKWHLGLGETTPDFNADLKPGPLELGFDYAFFIPATGDRTPCVFVENHRVVGLDPADPITVSYDKRIGTDPTGLERPDLLKIKADASHSQTIVNGISRIGYMTGGKKARWVDEDIADTLTQRAVAFLDRQQSGKPFFLFLPTHDIHEPMVPHPRFRGTSECGWRGDVIHQLDWTVGQVLAALDRRGLAQDTLVIFTSDNGGAIKTTYDDGTNALHALQSPNGVLRGTKGQLYEGGHRVPFISRWPGHIPAGRTSDALLGLIDLLPSFATLTAQKLPPGAAPDAVDVLPALLGAPGAQGRDTLVLQSNRQSPLALRAGPWKLIERQNGPHELYDLATDPTESVNLAARAPARVQALAQRLAAERAKSTP
ncbi:MAG: arylsulfatase [Opitutaceae bacterium]|nr:arylsulfatase [Opitutaceae bacterium]